MLSKWGNFYPDIRIHSYETGKTRDNFALAYTPVFVWRRLFLVVIPSVSYSMPFVQVQLLLISMTLYMIYYVGSRPHDTRSRVWLESFNECMILMIIYMMVLYSDFDTSVELAFMMGYVHAGVFVVMLAVNMAVMIYKQVFDARI